MHLAPLFLLSTTRPSFSRSLSVGVSSKKIFPIFYGSRKPRNIASTEMVLPLKRSKSARRIPPWLHNSSGFFLVTTTAIAWFSIFETSTWKAVHKIESEPQPPDAIILPIPPSGNENYPYFVNVTTARERIDSIIRNDVVVIEQQYDKHHRGYHLVTTNYPWSIVLPGMSDSDRLNEKDMFISPLQRTSRQAANHRCDIVATNGGPFDKGGKWNSGPTVSKGRMIRTKPFPEKSQFVGFGIAHRSIPSGSNTSGNSTNYRHWVLGEYSQLIRSSSPLSIWDFVTGFGWLVYDGKPRVTRSSNHSAMKKHNPTGAVRAPRTAVGLDKDSNLMLLVVDGCQNW